MPGALMRIPDGWRKNNMNHRFTLYCLPGQIFRPGRHYLIIDRWIPYSADYVILSHGIMTELEYQRIKQTGSVPIYQSMSFAWVGIYNYHKSKKYLDIQYIGSLYKSKSIPDLYGGKLNVK